MDRRGGRGSPRDPYRYLLPDIVCDVAVFVFVLGVFVALVRCIMA